MIREFLNILSEWEGTDEKLRELIKEISPDYQPWFSSVFYPSNELMTFFFTLQAAIGAFILGYIIGKYSRRK